MESGESAIRLFHYTPRLAKLQAALLRLERELDRGGALGEAARDGAAEALAACGCRLGLAERLAEERAGDFLPACGGAAALPRGGPGGGGARGTTSKHTTAGSTGKPTSQMP